MANTYIPLLIEQWSQENVSVLSCGRFSRQKHPHLPGLLHPPGFGTRVLLAWLGAKEPLAGLAASTTS